MYWALAGILLSEVTSIFSYVLETSEFLSTSNLLQLAVFSPVLLMSTWFLIPPIELILRRFEFIVAGHRSDVFLWGLLGVTVSIAYGSAAVPLLQNYAPWFQLKDLLLLMVIVFVCPRIAKNLKKVGPKQIEQPDSSHFISDQEKYSVDEDQLGFATKAQDFAGRVLLTPASSNIVYGLDAPWGVGKTSFVNFCCESWDNSNPGETIVYRFNPTQFEDSSQLFLKFSHGLSAKIKEQVYLPNIDTLLSTYTEALLANQVARILDLKASISSPSIHLEQSFEALENALKEINHRVIVIIDDLDRISFEDAKKVLYLVKYSFPLPNLTYLLIFDTQNLVKLGNANLDAFYVTEFLEKFVGVKLTLILNSQRIDNYLVHCYDHALKDVIVSDEANLRKIIDSLRDLLSSNSYYFYEPYIGDIRKVKKFLNIILLLKLDKPSLIDLDYDERDLVHLILVYLNFPTIFRHIYLGETDGKSGPYSVKRDYRSGEDGEGEGKGVKIDGYGVVKNHPAFKELLEAYGSNFGSGAKTLLEMLFDVKTRFGDGDDTFSTDKIDELQISTWACFNGDSDNRNLEKYLRLIVELDIQPAEKDFRFHMGLLTKIKSGIAVSEILKELDGLSVDSEAHLFLFWRVVRNQKGELSKNNFSDLIRSITESLHRYSLLEIESPSLGLRRTLPYKLINLLEDGKWSHTEEDDWSDEKEDETNHQIIGHIFGFESENEYKGILDSLFSPDRGVLGLYDVLVFRLYCSADRNGGKFRLNRALMVDADKNIKTSGVATEEIARVGMRRISQHIFKNFISEYIDKKISIIEQVESLTLSDVLSESIQFLIAKEDAEVNSLENSLALLKVQILIFVTYQLANDLERSGIGCGYYDLDNDNCENPKHEIKSTMNSYLFDICFTRKELNNSTGLRHFIFYMIANMQKGNFNNKYSLSKHYMDSIFIDDQMKAYLKHNIAGLRLLKFGSESVARYNNRDVFISETKDKLLKQLCEFYEIEE